MAARLTVGVLLVLAAVLAARSVFTVAQGDSALCTRLGRTEPTLYGPGLHLKSPLERVHRFDGRLVTSRYTGESFLTADQHALSVDFLLRWRLRDVALFFQRTGGDEDVAAQRLADLARDRLKSAVAREPLALVGGAQRGGLDDAGFEALQSAAGAFGVQLVDLQLQRIDLSDQGADAIYQRMEQGFTTQAQQLDATGTLQAGKIRTDAQRKRADLLADATRQAQQIRGQADARAAAIYAQAYGRNPELADFTQSLQAYKSSIGGEGDILVITPDSEFFKYLRSASGHPSAQPNSGH